MKRIIFISLFLLVFVGCRSVITENGRFLVSAIGVDAKEDKVLVSLETVIVNSSDSKSPYQKVVFKSEEKDFKTAIDKISFKSAKPLDFSHCAIIVFGDKITQSVKNDVYDYCLDSEEITVSVGFAATQNANELLNLEPKSEITIGYELAVMLETMYTENNMVFNNRFFEIENARLKGDLVNLEPKFIIDDKSFYLEGEKNQR